MESQLKTQEDNKAERISRVIFEHAARIGKEQDIARLIALNADLARDLVGADRCSVWLVDENSDELWTKVAHGVDKIRIPVERGLVGACVKTNQSIIANDVASDCRFLQHVDIGSGYRTESVLVVPLRADGQVIGALQVLNKRGGFSPEDAELLGFMASYSASEIRGERLRQEAEAARLLRRELDIAREVQSKLLPQEREVVSGLEYAGFCRSAKFVGGDYYDFLPLPGELFAFTLGDVSGKGIPAAVLMASIHMSLRGQLLRNPLPVSKAIEELNGTVYKSSSEDRYTTLFCGVLNRERTKLTYVNAGQIPPIVLRTGPDGQIDRLSGGGYPVGIFASAKYQEHTVELAPGDLIVCFSDGISEAVNTRDELLPDEAIEPVLNDCKSCSAEEIIHAVVQAVDDYAAGMEQFDDMTLIVMRVMPR